MRSIIIIIIIIIALFLYNIKPHNKAFRKNNFAPKNFASITANFARRKSNLRRNFIQRIKELDSSEL